MEKRENVKSESIILLLLTAIFLVVSTYAWFTTNITVRVDTLDIYVEAGEGLQISLDGLYWKTVIQADEITDALLEDTYPSHINHVPGRMDPVSTAAITDSNGLMEMFLGTAVLDDTIGSPTFGEYILTAEKMTDDRDTVAGYAAFDLFFKTNSDMNLYIQPDAGAYDNALVGSANHGKGIENATRIAFVNQGYISIMDPRRDYALAAAAQALKGATSIRVWEPNYDAHTEAAKLDTFNFFGVPLDSLIWEDAIPYDGIKSVISPQILLNRNNATFYPSYFERIPETNFFRTEADPRTNLRDTGVILYAGVTKVRVYIWLEGQDYDCQDSASGSDISFVLIFQGENVGTVVP